MNVKRDRSDSLMEEPRDLSDLLEMPSQFQVRRRRAALTCVQLATAEDILIRAALHSRALRSVLERSR
jgi:hypothetical protein